MTNDKSGAPQSDIQLLGDLYLSCAFLRLRVVTNAPQIKAFSDWEKNTVIMEKVRLRLDPDAAHNYTNPKTP